MKTWRDYEQLAIRENLVQLIETYGTPTRIARILGCSKESVRHAMNHHSLVSKRYKISEDMRKRLKL